MKLMRSGMVRDLYKFESTSSFYESGTACIVESDRSPESGANTIIGKGKTMIKLSRNWARRIDDSESYGKSSETAYLNYLDDGEKKELGSLNIDMDRVQGQFWLKVVPIRAVVYGYLTGLLLDEYIRGKRYFYGFDLPNGLKESEQLERPLFAPIIKGDYSRSIASVSKVEYCIDQSEAWFYYNHYDVGTASLDKPATLAKKIRNISIDVYNGAAKYSKNSGLVLACADFTFGVANGKLLLGGGILTPDVATYWLVDTYQSGAPQKSFEDYSLLLKMLFPEPKVVSLRD